jgi:outer membrane protein OmpA-like peptidoglycan-associated protein
VRKIIQLGGAAGTVVALAGCSVLGVGGPAKISPAGPPVVISQEASPSILMAVLDGPGSGPALSSLVDATARAREDLTVLQAGTPAATVASSTAPAPPTVVVAGRPAAPGGSETPYQAAQYANRLKSWDGKVAAGRRTEAVKARQSLAAWLNGIGLQAKVSKLASPTGTAASLVAESSVAAGALADLAQDGGNEFGPRRVILLYTDDLASRPPAGELTGDTVIVITTLLPTAAAASAAQANLLAAGAAQAAVIGPEVTGTQLAALVSSDLAQAGTPESVSAPVLFANNSAALSSEAIAQLTTLLPKLRGTGVTAVINGFASSPGTALANYMLSFSRAANVAAFFESKGAPASSLIIVGHGASDLVAAGNSGSNRRVAVTIENSP